MASTLEVQLADGSTVEMQVPDGMSADDLHSTIDSIAKQHTQKAPQQAQLPIPSPQDALQQLDPSNVGKLAGVAGINAPGATLAGLGGLPGGNPQDIMQGVQSLVNNPRQIQQAAQRTAAVAGGAPLNSQEQVSARTGQVAGGVAGAFGMPFMEPSIEATGPFTAGVADPSTALPGALEKAGQELGQAEASVPQAASIISDRLRRLMSMGKAGINKVAEEGIQTARDTSTLQSKSPEELLAYRDALKQLQGRGGRYANAYATASNIVENQLANRFPQVMNAIKNYAVNAVAKEGKNAVIPWLTAAINPEVGAAKAAYGLSQTPAVRNALGALTGLALRDTPGLASVALDALKKQAKRKGLDYGNGQ